MEPFVEEYVQILQQTAAKISWGHILFDAENSKPFDRKIGIT
jgi:hypothetical protein